MKTEIKKLEVQAEKAYLEKSKINKLEQVIASEIKKDVDNLFDFNASKYKLTIQLADEKFPLFTKENQKDNLNYYAQNFKQFKNRITLMTKKNNFSLSELNHMIKTYREEFILNQYLQFMDLWRRQKLEKLYAKMDLIAKMTKNMKVFDDVFGRFWDLSIHDLLCMDMSFIKKLQALKESKSFIKQIAELLGRAASSFKEYEEYLIKELKYIPSKHQTFYSPENMTWITLGNNIPDLLPMSLAFLKNKNATKLFKMQYHEKKLLQFKKEAQLLDEIEVSRAERRLKKNYKGPFVLVIDTSGSMHGEPETIAKAMALAFVHNANKEDRKCFIINFSTQIVEFDASDLSSSWNEFYCFLSISFHDGIDINPALAAAIKKVEDRKWKNSEVILISDLIINALDNNLEEKIKKLKKDRVRFHSLTIGNSYHKLNTNFLDNNWIYDGSKESIDKIIKDLDKYNNFAE